MIEEKPASKPTFREGLEKGYRETRKLSSTPSGKLLLCIILGSAFWLFFIAPATCMKLEEVFPKTRIGVFVGVEMYLAWVVLFIILGIHSRRRRNIRLFGKAKPSFKEAMPYMKEEIRQKWKEISR